MVSKKVYQSQRMWVGGNGKGEEKGHEVYAQKQPICQRSKEVITSGIGYLSEYSLHTRTVSDLI